MARCALISFSGYPATPSSLMPDNGLASLAACLTQAGHEPLILDLNTVSTMARLYPESIASPVRPLARAVLREGRRLSWRDKARMLRLAWRLERHQQAEIDRIATDLVDELAAWQPTLVGFKLWNGDGFSGAVRVAHAVRRMLPGVRVVAGGPHVDYFGGHILNYTDAFDVLVRSEGERALVHLCEWADGKRPINAVAGALWRNGKALASNPVKPLPGLAAVPLPCYDPVVYPALRGDDKIRIGVIEESRGCPQRCSFCIHPIKSGGRWRVKRPDRVLAEIGRLREQMKTNTFVYAGSNTPAKAAVAYARALIQGDLDIRYACFGHAKGMQQADFDLLRRSGCQAIFYGIESGSPRILREGFNKTATVDDIRRVILATKAAGIFAIGSVIHPAPFETEQTRAATLRLLEEIRPDSVPVTAPGIIPGTPWHQAPWRYGFALSRRRDLYAYGLTYKIRLLFPPSMWKPLPYTLDGKSSKVFLNETARFINDVEERGIMTQVPHELHLMAQALDTPVRVFRDEARLAFYSGDAAWAANLAERVNRAVRPGTAAADRARPGTAVAGRSA